MRRITALLAVLSLLVAACAGDAEPATTTAAAPTTSTTTSSTTTTTAPTTTTTTLPKLELDGADADLTDLIVNLYAGKDVAAPDGIAAAFADSDGSPPLTGSASVADWDETTRLAVINMDSDVTLAVADPDWRIVGGWWPSVGIDPSLGSFPKVVAVVGSDARPGENRETARADSIHFVGLDGQGAAAVVGVPRDSWVPIPGRGNSKINASLAYGGPDLMMETFKSVTDLDFDGYVLTGFAGFTELIGILGGLDIDVPHAFNDKAAKAYLQAGQQILDGAQALAMSRTRKTLARGDFSRQENGGLVMIAAQAMLHAQGTSVLPSLLAESHPHFSTDMGPEEILTLAAAIARVEPAKATNIVAPGGTGSAGGASVVFLADSATDLWSDLADGRLDQTE